MYKVRRDRSEQNESKGLKMDVSNAITWSIAIAAIVIPALMVNKKKTIKLNGREKRFIRKISKNGQVVIKKISNNKFEISEPDEQGFCYFNLQEIIGYLEEYNLIKHTEDNRDTTDMFYTYVLTVNGEEYIKKMKK